MSTEVATDAQAEHPEPTKPQHRFAAFTRPDAFPDDHPAAVKLRKLFAELARLDADRPTNLAKLKRLLKQFEALDGQGSLPNAAQLRETITAYRAELAELERKLRKCFGVELETCLLPLGLKLTGQYPLLHAGFFTFKMLDEQGQVEIWYGYEQERLDTVALVASDVMTQIVDLQKRLGSQLPTAAFLSKLEEAYRRLPRDPNHPGVAITSVLPEMAYLLQSKRYYQNPIREHYRSYSRADFSYDLYRCQGDSDLRGRLHLTVTTRSYTSDRQDFLWIPNIDGISGTTYSHLSMKEPAR